MIDEIEHPVKINIPPKIIEKPAKLILLFLVPRKTGYPKFIGF